MFLTAMILNNEWGNYVLILLRNNDAINNIKNDFLDCYVFLWLFFELSYCSDIGSEHFVNQSF